MTDFYEYAKTAETNAYNASEKSVSGLQYTDGIDWSRYAELNEKKVKHPATAKKAIKLQRAVTISLAIALVAVLTMLSMLLFVFKKYDVDGISMSPTIENGSQIWVNKLKKPQRFDVVAIEAEAYNRKANWQILQNGGVPISEDNLPARLLKRIVGVAGDTLSVDEDRYLVVETNGAKKYLGAENYGNGKLSKLSYWLNGKEDFSGSVTVPEGYVFVLGDFRGKTADGFVSVDSRMFGMVALEDIIGVAV